MIKNLDHESRAVDSSELLAIQAKVRMSLESGCAVEAREQIEAVRQAFPATRLADDWVELGDVHQWPDRWLVAAVRNNPPDSVALDALAERHWRSLFARCKLLVFNSEKAADLAQDAWCRVLRVRHSLRPEGNFPAYLSTVATNLWRDRQRAGRRAGAMADERLLSLEMEMPVEAGAGLRLQDILPDLQSLQAAEQQRLRQDLDEALSHLPPTLHEVLVARFLAGESCADIGRRHGRTEQTISAWVREAVRQIKQFLAEPPHRPPQRV
jgi:RNA polymerase sigma factor (sigma-70 family)